MWLRPTIAISPLRMEGVIAIACGSRVLGTSRAGCDCHLEVCDRDSSERGRDGVAVNIENQMGTRRDPTLTGIIVVQEVLAAFSVPGSSLLIKW
jgi:hypothetical protein